MDQHKNFTYSEVAVAPNPLLTGTELSVTVSDGGKFAHFPFNAVCFLPSIQPTAANAEIVRVTGRSGDVLTIIRAQETTTAKNIAIGWVIAAGITVKTITDIEDAIAATLALLPVGVVVGDTDEQTLVNKTLTSPIINTPTFSAGAVGTADVAALAITTAKLAIKHLAGWDVLAATGTRVSNTQMTISGDVTALLAVGLPLELTDTTTKWYNITSFSYSTGTGLTTINFTGGTSYILVGNATNIYFGNRPNPVGFPQWFALAAPTWVVAHFDNGSGGQPTTSEFRFAIIGRTLVAHCKANGTKAQTNNVILFDIAAFPVAPANSTDQTPVGHAYCDVGNQTATVLNVGTAMYIQFPANITDNATLGQVSFQISFEI